MTERVVEQVDQRAPAKRQRTDAVFADGVGHRAQRTERRDPHDQAP